LIENKVQTFSYRQNEGGKTMADKEMLEGKRILIVDDEPDVLDTLEDLLSMCDLVKASRFEEAKELLETSYFDITILDIMGVDGYMLLDIATKRDVIAVMLTAHALSPEDTVKSYKKGAASYVPKEEMANITTYLNDILEAKEQGKNFWWRWFDRFASYYDKKFGPHWKDKDKEFWEKFPFYL
jgi:CheY-like chemotaxis protein